MKEHFFGFLESSWYKKYSCTNIVTLLMYENILICLFSVVVSPAWNRRIDHSRKRK